MSLKKQSLKKKKNYKGYNMPLDFQFPEMMQNKSCNDTFLEDQIPGRLKRGIDLENFEVKRIISKTTKIPVFIMKDSRADAFNPWCVQYRGTVHYYRTEEEAYDYCASRRWIKKK